MEEIKLNLACGRDYREGYINVDSLKMFPDCKVDICEDVFTFEREENSVDEILVSHFLMYVRPEPLNELLVKWFKWLKPGGKLIIEQPDISKIAKIIVREKYHEIYTDWGMINMFGRDGQPPHTWGYYPKLLADMVRLIGFANIKTEAGGKKPNRDFKLTAIK